MNEKNAASAGQDIGPVRAAFLREPYGYLNNQFSMDEYQGNLRLVTTLSHSGGNRVNSLLVLEEKLKKISEIQDQAPGEKVCPEDIGRTEAIHVRCIESERRARNREEGGAEL